MLITNLEELLIQVMKAANETRPSLLCAPTEISSNSRALWVEKPEERVIAERLSEITSTVFSGCRQKCSSGNAKKFPSLCCAVSFCGKAGSCENRAGELFFSSAGSPPQLPTADLKAPLCACHVVTHHWRLALAPLGGAPSLG